MFARQAGRGAGNPGLEDRPSLSAFCPNAQVLCAQLGSRPRQTQVALGRLGVMLKDGLEPGTSLLGVVSLGTTACRGPPPARGELGVAHHAEKFFHAASLTGLLEAQ